jgi:hypothetical protein
MKRVIPVALAVCCSLGTAHAQSGAADQRSYGFEVDGLLRQEWTNHFFDPNPSDDVPAPADQSRRLFRLRPRLLLGGERFQLGVGGELDYGSDKNVDPKPAPPLRDNYDSRTVRLDQAFAHIQPAQSIVLDGGRFPMPFALTEMIWDRDLRVQGGAARVPIGPIGDLETLTLGALVSESSHVFGDGKARLTLFNGTARFKVGNDAHLELCGSYLDWKKLGDLEPMIRRQNSRDAAGLVPDQYQTVDIVGRVIVGGKVPLQLVGNVAWNTKLTDNNQGLWLAAVLGSVTDGHVRAEYTFARLDKDVTVAAYNSDDFFWGTGWQGHRLDLGIRTEQFASIHFIGQLQRFKDSKIALEQTHDIRRYRIEMRFKK